MDSIFLSLGDTALTLDIGPQQHRIPIGLATLVNAFGQHMPDALTLENAIADVEDAIMPAGRWLPAGASMLQTADPLLRQLIHSSTADPQATQASRDAIENLFELLARQAQQPGHADPQLPQTAEHAAALLILREAMHHWGMAALQASGN
ncbi:MULTISPECIES: hypothetical protein [Comamonas]|nr:MULTISPECIES: hypothetical protein [Comamonas]UUC94215.1 hypothetical protein NOX35_02320 [Comamonas sp. C11]